MTSTLLTPTWSSMAKGKARAIPSLAPLRNFSSSSSTLKPVPAEATAETTVPSSSTQHPSSSSSSSSTSHPVINDTPTALELLKSQPSHYIIASLVGRTFLLHPRDVLTVPRIRDVQVGDVLELDRIHEVGSRDYTLRAQDPMSGGMRGLRKSPHHSDFRSVDAGLDARIVRALKELRELRGNDASQEGDASDPAVEAANTAMSLRTSTTSWATRLMPSGLAHVGATLSPSTVRARAVVVEHTKSAMERIVKFKRRKGYKKTIEHKQPYTRLRLEAIKLGEGE